MTKKPYFTRSILLSRDFRTQQKRLITRSLAKTAYFQNVQSLHRKEVHESLDYEELVFSKAAITEGKIQNFISLRVPIYDKSNLLSCVLKSYACSVVRIKNVCYSGNISDIRTVERFVICGSQKYEQKEASKFFFNTFKYSKQDCCRW